MKKINYCNGGGYARLLYRLLSDSEIGCQHCEKMLADAGFKKDDMESTVNALLDGTLKSAWVPAQGMAAEIKVEEEEAQVAGDDGRLAALAWLRNLAPTFRLLQPGCLENVW